MKKMWLAIAALALSLNSFAKDEPTYNSLEVKVSDEVMKEITDPNQRAALENLVIAARKSIQLVSNIPFNPPQSRFDLSNAAQIVDISKLFRGPELDGEVAALAKDANGKPKRLNEEQIAGLKENGYIVVPSVKYPGQNYVWQFTAFFQIGAKNIALYIDKGAASALRKVTVVVPMLAMGAYDAPISIRHGLSNIVYGLRDTLSLLVGLSETKPKYSDYEVTKMVETARSKYQQGALAVVNHSEDLRRDLGFQPDVRLFDEALMKKALPLIRAVDEQISKTWGQIVEPGYVYPDRDFPKEAQLLRNQFRSQLIQTGVPSKDVEARMEDLFASRREVAQLQALALDKDIEALSPGLGKLYADRARALKIIAAGEKSLAREVTDRRQTVATELAVKHSVKSKIPEWMSEQSDNAANAFYQQIVGARYAAMAQQMREEGLAQEAFLFEKNVQFVRDQEKEMSEALIKEVVAANEYVFSRPIWRPENWVVTPSKTEGGKTVYELQKTRETIRASNSLLWRVQNAISGSRATASWAMYKLLIANLWNGPVGLKSLFKVNAFPSPNKARFNRETGEITYGETGTLVSRLADMNESLKRQRQDFESRTTHGLFGKDFTRPFLILKHAGIRYIGGTLLVGGQTALTAGNVAVLGTVGALAPIWSPVLNLTLMGINAGLYDFYAPHSPSRRGFKARIGGFFSDLSPILNTLLYKTVIKGAAQTTLSALAIPFVTLAADAQYMWSTARGHLFYVNDWLMRGIIRWRASVPDDNVPGVIKLTAGPGLAKSYFYQIDADIATVAVWARLEQIALNEYKKTTKEMMDAPEVSYQEFTRVFGEFIGFAGSKGQPSAKEQLQDSRRENQKKADAAFGPYEQLYSKLLNVPDRAQNIRMTEADLAKAQTAVAGLVQEFITGVSKNWSEDQLKDFWYSRSLQPGDWDAMAKTLLADVFTSNINQPLETLDQTFRLKVTNPGLTDLADAVLTGRNVPEFDKASQDRLRPARVLFCSALLAK